MFLDFRFIVFVFGAVIVLTKGHLCPDGLSRCSDESTCCLLGDEEYGCCPLVDAVCCNDHTHCCPKATKCDVDRGLCLKENGLPIKIKRKQKAMKLPRGDVICPDKRSKCPSGSTCCDLGFGRYGCCPVPEAVCCSDHLHCCPKGTICHVSEGRCVNPETGEASSWYLKSASKKVIRKVSVKNVKTSIQCKDGSKCLIVGKCCDTIEGYSTCCPFKIGVCCESGRHCCPHGFQCDSEEGRCKREDDFMAVTLPWTKTLLSEDNQEQVIFCNDGSTCPATNKCCPFIDEDGYVDYSCCPLSQGVCCGESCCPYGYTCTDDGKCEKDAAIERIFFDQF